jgi:hypothetical protein
MEQSREDALRVLCAGQVFNGVKDGTITQAEFEFWIADNNDDGYQAGYDDGYVSGYNTAVSD